MLFLALSRQWTHRAWRQLLPSLLATLSLFLLVGCQQHSTEATGLLAAQLPAKSRGLTHAERMTDGQVPPVGSGWNSSRTAVFSSTKGFALYDLGRSTALDSVALLGDNNDDYLVEISADGKSFEPLWTAQRSRTPGLQWRVGSGLGAKGRFLRLSPKRGDRALSVAEFSVFSSQPAHLPPPLKRVSALDGGLEFRNSILLAGTALLVAVVLASQSAGLLWNLAMVLLALLGVGQLLLVFKETYPLDMLEVSLARAVSAFVALGVVARETYGRKGYEPFKPLNIGVLAVVAVIGVGGFFNLGKPQFFDAKEKQPSVVHNFDMRVYFPVAKYFDELKYDGLYLASALSYAEEHGGLKTNQLQRTELRDLHDHRMRKVSDIEAEVAGIRDRFSDKRWAEFKVDMAYFWETMGSGGYLGSMRDHGGNATPLWMAVAHLMFRSMPASNEVLLWAGALDPLLLLLFGVCVWRSFGVRTALVCLVIFGANDFYMFGSNWAGATLRNDWMVYLGLGACAFKVGRYRLGGALLAFSALIRAFPAMALLILGIPVVYFLVERFLKDRRLPRFRDVFDEQRWFFDAALGAVAFTVCAFLFSSLVLGFDAWALWVEKISSFTASPHVNHIGLLTVTSGSEGNQLVVNRARMPLHVAATLLFVVLTFWAAYRRRPHVVALLGIALMPVFMYPANYYIHFIFLLPMLVVEPLREDNRFRREVSGKVWMLLLGLCAAQYFTVKEQSLDLHFYNAAVLLMATLFGVLVTLLPRDDEGLVLLPLRGLRAAGAKARAANASGEDVGSTEESASSTENESADTNPPPL